MTGYKYSESTLVKTLSTVSKQFKKRYKVLKDILALSFLIQYLLLFKGIYNPV
jgi:hypothetical protein